MFKSLKCPDLKCCIKFNILKLTFNASEAVLCLKTYSRLLCEFYAFLRSCKVSYYQIHIINCHEYSDNKQCCKLACI